MKVLIEDYAGRKEVVELSKHISSLLEDFTTDRTGQLEDMERSLIAIRNAIGMLFQKLVHQNIVSLDDAQHFCGGWGEIKEVE